MDNAAQPARQPRKETLMLPGGLLRVVATTVVAGLLIFALGVLVLREVVFPQADAYRSELLTQLSRVAGEPVAAESLRVDWKGLRPRVVLESVSVGESDRLIWEADVLEAVVGWQSLLRGEPYFHRLTATGADFAVERDANGRVRLAGLLDPQRDPEVVVRWILSQGELVLKDARLSWRDHLRDGAPLYLEQLDLRLRRVGARYRFGARALVSQLAQEPLELRGDLVGDDPTDLHDWSGQLFARADQARLESLQPWLDYPLRLAGQAGGRAWLELREGRARMLHADFALEDVDARPDADLPILRVSSFDGGVTLRRQGSGWDAVLRAQQWRDASGAVLTDSLELDMHLDAQHEPKAVHVQAGSLDLARLAQLSRSLPVPERIRAWRGALQPRGKLENITLAWSPRPDSPPNWQVQGRFSDLALQSSGRIPGVSGLHGEFDGNQDAGQFAVYGHDMALDMPEVFSDPLLSFRAVRVKGSWRRDNGDWMLQVAQGVFDNADAAGGFEGEFRPVKGERGVIDVNAWMDRADVSAVWRYVPRVVNERARVWLRESLVGARSVRAEMAVQGDLERFPFERSEDGVFDVDVHVSGGRLNYAEGWPEISDIDGRVRFRGRGMQVQTTQARIFSVQLGDVDARIPELGREDSRLGVTGQAVGPTAEFLRYVGQMPVALESREFVAGIAAEGDGKLALDLDLPLRSPSDAEVEAVFRFADNRLRLLPWLPPIVQAEGQVDVSESGVAISRAGGRVLGHPVTVTADNPQPGHMNLRAEGALSADGLRAWLGKLPLLERVSGQTGWQAQVDVRPQQTRIVLDSELSGLALDLPAPMEKGSDVPWPLRVETTLSQGGQRYDVSADLADLAQLRMGGLRQNGRWRVQRGGLGVGVAPNVSDDGLMVSARLGRLNLDRWRDLLTTSEEGGLSRPGMPEVVGWDVKIDQLTLLEQSLRGVEVAAVLSGSEWSGQLASNMAAGGFTWRGGDRGALGLDLEFLELGIDDGNVRRGIASELSQRMQSDLPDLDVRAGHFALRGMELGALRLVVRNESERLRVDELQLRTAESRLQGEGWWRAADGEGRTELDLDLTTSDAARLLRRLNYPAAVDAGAVRLRGNVGWNGLPTRLDFPSLSGQLRLDVGQGRFRQLDPGVGRLLGVLSLQALPRRMQLDFSDVFSEGFAFDSVSGSIELAAGRARSDDLHLVGPAAQIWLDGSTDLVRETQDLTVVVHPTLSESVAVGAAAGLINPVAGVIAYLAQKALRDPLEQMFAYGYHVTGTWSEPQVKALPVGAQRQSGQDQEGRARAQ